MAKEIRYTETGFDELDRRNLSEDLIKILPEGTTNISVEKIAHGNVNRNVKISTKQGNYFCKIAPLWYQGSLRREEWALRKVKEAGCLVPKPIIYLDSENTIIPGYEILLSDFVDGRLLSEEENKRKYFPQIIEAYNTIHSVPMKGFGWLTETLDGRYDTWLDFLMQIENEETILCLGDDWIERLAFFRTRIASVLGDSVKRRDSGRLLYGDFNYSNFIVDERDRIVTLDLQNCFSGDRLYDAGMAIANDAEFEEFLNCFDGFDPDKPEAGQEVVYLYSLRHLFSMLTFFSATNNQHMVSFIKKRFLDLRKKLST